MAVIVSKANYLLGLAELLNARRGDIHVPVYLANSIRLPEVKEPEVTRPGAAPRYEFDAKGEPIYIPVPIMSDLPDLAVDGILNYMRDYAERVVKRDTEQNEESFKNGLLMRVLEVNRFIEKHGNAIITTLYESSLGFVRLIRSNRDTIWPFIIKNLYKPLFLKEEFDIAVGNPPWLSYQYVADPDHQQVTERILHSGSILVDVKPPSCFH